MTRLFVSQPMRDKTDEEIIVARERAAMTARSMLNDDVQLIDSYFNKSAPAGVNAPLWYLAKSLELMASADVVYFAEDWKRYRGCLIEYRCAKDYGLEIIGELND